MSGSKRPVEPGTVPPSKKRRSPSTSSESSSGRSSSTARPERRTTSSKQARGARGRVAGDEHAGGAASVNRRYETVIPDSQSPPPVQQEEDVKPDLYLSYRSRSASSTTDSSSFGANSSRSSDLDVKPPPFERSRSRSRSFSTDSKPSGDEMARSLSSGSSHNGDDLSARSSLDSDVKNFELDIKPLPGIDYRAAWMEDRLQKTTRLPGFGPQSEPEPHRQRSAIRSTPPYQPTTDRARSHAPSPIAEDHGVYKKEEEDHTMASLGDMPPPRAPLARSTELDWRRRERSTTASEDGHYPQERHDQASSSRAGSARSDSAAQEQQGYGSRDEGYQSASPAPCVYQEEEEWREDEEEIVEEEQEMAEMEVEPTPEVEADPVDRFLSSFLPAGPRPIGVKARLQNELAKSTALYTPENRVMPVPQPPQQPQPRPSPPPPPSYSFDAPMDDSTPTPRPASPRPPSPSPQPSLPPAPAPVSEAAMAAARGLSPASENISVGLFDDVEDELDDYDEEENAASGGLADILAPQQHYEAPTEIGTVDRWYLVVSAPQGKAVPIQEDLNWVQLDSDVSLLQSYDIPVPQVPSFKPPRRYLSPGSDGLKLLTEMPGGDPSSLFARTRLDEMWEDFAHHGEKYKHRPRWEPKLEEWDEVLRTMKEKPECLEVGDLLDVLEEVFARGRRKVDEELLRDIYRKNWLWFDQIRQLARVRQKYFALASDNVTIEVHTLHEKLRSSWKVDLDAKMRKLKAAKEGHLDGYKELLEETRELESGKRKNRVNALGLLAERLRRIDEKKSRMEEQRA